MFTVALSQTSDGHKETERTHLLRDKQDHVRDLRAASCEGTCLVKHHRLHLAREGGGGGTQVRCTLCVISTLEREQLVVDQQISHKASHFKDSIPFHKELLCALLTLCVVSSGSPPLIKMPLVAPTPVPTMTAVGVARPSAQGQAMRRTAMA